MISFNYLNKCVACDSSSLSMSLSLGKQPLANSFTKIPTVQERYPLELNRCSDCGHLQLSVNVDRSAIFSNYIYRSNTTKTLRDYFDWFAKEITDMHGVGRILDVACNDGTQLDSFKRLGWTTYGVDPAENLSQYNSHDHRVAFFDDDCLDLGRFDVIIAQNVLAHTDNPRQILSTASKMSDNIYIQTSQANMIKQNEFDTIYHEHISFFSPSSINSLAKTVGLKLNTVRQTPIHGGSFVFHLTPGRRIDIPITWSESDVNEFSIKSKSIIKMLKYAIDDSPYLIGYGAAAKAMTVLNATGNGPKYILDDAVDKQYTFTPGLGIPVLPTSLLKEEKNDIDLIPLAWNFADEIASRVRSSYDGEVKRVLKYFPRVVWS